MNARFLRGPSGIRGIIRRKMEKLLLLVYNNGVVLCILRNFISELSRHPSMPRSSSLVGVGNRPYRLLDIFIGGFALRDRTPNSNLKSRRVGIPKKDVSANSV